MSIEQATPRVTLTVAREVARFGLYATDAAWDAHRTHGAPVNLVKDLYPDWQYIPAEGKFLQAERFIAAIVHAPNWSLTRLDAFIRAADEDLTEAQRISFYERGQNGLTRIYLADMLKLDWHDVRLTSVTNLANLVHDFVVYDEPDRHGELAAMLPCWLTICDVVHAMVSKRR